MCSLSIEVSSEEILEFQLAYKSHHNMIFQGLIHLLICFMGQPLIYIQTFGEVLLDSDPPFVWEVMSSIVESALIAYSYANCLIN